jgi:hypothetical protein
MVAGAITFPLLGSQGTAIWWEFLADGELEHTLLTAFGVGNGWLALVPVLAAIVAAIVFAARATPRTPIRDLAPAFAAVIAWAGVSIFGPALAEVAGEEAPLDGGEDALKLVALGVALSMATLSALALRSRLGQPPPGEPSSPASEEPAAAEPAPALGERTE